MDGLRFLETLAAELPEVPVVVMSAYTDVASTAGAFRGGAFDYLSKPFDLDQAVAEGATMVRVGAALFGPRPAVTERGAGPR